MLFRSERERGQRDRERECERESVRERVFVCERKRERERDHEKEKAIEDSWGPTVGLLCGRTVSKTIPHPIDLNQSVSLCNSQWGLQIMILCDKQRCRVCVCTCVCLCVCAVRLETRGQTLLSPVWPIVVPGMAFRQTPGSVP